MKQLTLEISERQEQEELSEALQQLQRVTLSELNILLLIFKENLMQIPTLTFIRNTESCFSKNINVLSMCVRSCQSSSLFFSSS